MSQATTDPALYAAGRSRGALPGDPGMSTPASLAESRARAALPKVLGGAPRPARGICGGSSARPTFAARAAAPLSPTGPPRGQGPALRALIHETGATMPEYLIAHVGHTSKSYEHICWWKPESKGYTICTTKAGRYSAEKAREICTSSECIAVPAEAAEGLARTTPYYRQPNGTLGKLYDGGPHAPVENSSRAWTQLKADALVIGKYAKPTPMAPSRAREIYLEPQP